MVEMFGTCPGVEATAVVPNREDADRSQAQHRTGRAKQQVERSGTVLLNADRYDGVNSDAADSAPATAGAIPRRERTSAFCSSGEVTIGGVTPRRVVRHIFHKTFLDGNSFTDAGGSNARASDTRVRGKREGECPDMSAEDGQSRGRMVDNVILLATSLDQSADQDSATLV